MRRIITALALASTAMAIPALAGTPRFEASITRTAGGVAHIRAGDWGGIGYGVGYAYAQDNLCLLAQEFVTVAGDRSRWFGKDAKAVLGFQEVDNLSSDVFFRASIDLPMLRAAYGKQGKDVLPLIDGYVAGYNRLLRDIGPAGVPEACRGKDWVRPISRDDMLRISQKQMLLAGSLALAPAIANAAPPQAAKLGMAGELPDYREIGFGSNGWGFGSEVTEGGRGILVGNPHFPWFGPSRFWQMHVTIPGVTDVSGVGLAGTPLPAIGFNKDLAWTHTVTAARHFTLFQLKLDPADSTTYLVDGKRVKMTRQTVTVPLGDGQAPITRTLYRTRFGQVMAIPKQGLEWNGEQAFAVRDANESNQRALATWMALGQAHSVAQAKQVVTSTLGIPWVNTIAADREGNVLHADVTAVPNVSGARLAACSTGFTGKFAPNMFVLDGSRSACEWERAKGTSVAGLMPAADQAVWERRDYVANSNDSYWLSNASAPYRQLSPLLHEWASTRSLRTRSGLIEIIRQLDLDAAEHRKLNRLRVREMALANHSLAAELALAPTIALCRSQSDLSAACAALEGWDGRFDLDSRGAALFNVFWMKVESQPWLWSVPFDVNDPLHTPRGLATSGEGGEKLLKALRDAVADLDREGIALDARWGDVQFAMRGEERIPVHGADGRLGVLNVQMSRKVKGGLTPYHGSSFMQVVGFDANGPVADVVLSYSQSTDPASPWFADQTRLYSAKQWQRAPYTPEEVEAARIGPVQNISE